MSKGYYDFIEIGTSDFDTLIEKAADTTKGLSIEPLKYYLDRLPNKENVIKVQAAISDTDSTLDIYHIEENKIQEHNLPYWVRGCNSVNKPHSYARKTIGEDLYDSIISTSKIPTISWATLIKQYDIQEVNYLKIDTEGFEYVILKGYFEECEKNPRLLANKIKFEYNENSNRESIEDLLSTLKGYNIERLEDDIVLTKNSKVEKAYILYANDVYFDTITACIKSIKEYSNFPIFVYMLNSDLKVNIEGVTTIKWECDLKGEEEGMYDKSNANFYINRKNEKIYKLLIQRPLVTKHVLENYANTVAYIDCDSIATPNIERIFEYYKDGLNYPYFVEGIYDYLFVDGRGGAESKEDLSGTLEHPACELFGVNQYVRQCYRQSGYYVANESCISFLEEWYEMCIHPEVLGNFTYYAPYNEETILNVLLWKHNIHKGLPYLYVNGSLSTVDRIYTEIEFKGHTQSLSSWFKVPAYKEDLLFFHGEKRLDVMEAMISRIKDYTTNTRKKILYIAPHLSTGGQPQYLLKKVQHFKKDFDIHVAEYNLASNDFVVQRAQLQDILGSKFHVVGEDKQNLLSIIKKVRPDIIHIEEVPEFFMSDEIAVEIFGKVNRDYFIVTTTHSSNTTPSALKFHPDKFVLVSKWSQNKFTEELSQIPNDIWEYPIGVYDRDQKQAQQKLELDPEYKHVLMVGLFTPGKNQGEIFEVARQLEKYKIKFHFVGNQAGNFKEYWEPIMQTKPDNCVIWGERNDVADFYQACDLFYFSSKLELNPLSIKEALSYGLPCIFRKLHTYLDTYDNKELVTYIDDDLKVTSEVILEKLQPEFNEIPGWFAYPDLYDEAVGNAKNGDTFVEVGAWFGKSTNYLASKIKESGKDIKLTAVDTWKGTEDEDLHQAIVGTFNGDIFYEFIDNTVRAGNYGNINLIKDTSHNAANQFQNNSIDYIMIDAGHSYKDVKDDIQFWYSKVKPGGTISGDDYGVFSGVNQAVDEYFYNQHTTGFRTWKRKKPRIQIKHLLTRPDDMRERVSIQSIKQLEKYGMYYEQIINTPYEGLAPVENCRRPDRVSKDNKPGHIGNGLGWITGRHYGCYLAHRGALETMDTENFDYTLVFEADAFIYTGLEEFVEIVHRACFISERDNVYYIGLANNPSWGRWNVDELFAKTDYNQDLAHCYLIPNRHKQFYMDRLVDVGWDVADLWYNHVFYDYKFLRYTTNKVYSKQVDGYSLLDETIKTWD